ncbi:MAG: ATP-grasp domain-containing protein [Solirubrobacterales bacterium]
MSADRPAVILTAAGKRTDIVSAFAEHATVIVCDPNPLAPAQYAAHERRVVPRIDDPGYVPALEALVEEFGVGAVVPLTDLDIEVLARSDLPAFVPPAEIARRTFDKYECHLLLGEHGLPSPPTWLPDEVPADLDVPVVVKPRAGSGARNIFHARDRREREFFVGYIDEDVMVQRAMGGREHSVDVLCDLDGRCLNAIPRTMLESRGGESIKGMTFDDPELVELGRTVAEALTVRGPATIQAFRDPEIGLGITDVNTRFGGAFCAPMFGGGSYPELICRMAAGERPEPHVGTFQAGRWFTRYFWQLELEGPVGPDLGPSGPLRPTGRDIVAGAGPPPPR